MASVAVLAPSPRAGPGHRRRAATRHRRAPFVATERAFRARHGAEGTWSEEDTEWLRTFWTGSLHWFAVFLLVWMLLYPWRGEIVQLVRVALGERSPPALARQPHIDASAPR